jgi:hypothetical protein
MEIERQQEHPELPPSARVVDHVKSLPAGSKFTARAIALQCEVSVTTVRKTLHVILGLKAVEGVYTVPSRRHN